VNLTGQALKKLLKKETFPSTGGRLKVEGQTVLNKDLSKRNMPIITPEREITSFV